VNAHAEYRRHLPPSANTKPSSPAIDALANHLAVRSDPTLVISPTTTAAAPTGKRITWVRPTELASFATPAIGRGIDLHAHLVRRGRSAPIAATSAVRRSVPGLTSSGVASPTSSRAASTQEGPKL
jgi:hypothetical protein